MSDQPTIEQRIHDILINQLNPPEGAIKPEALIWDDLGADSLDTVELIMALEDEFKYEITEEEAMRMKTVGDIVKFITDKSAA